jgi:RNA polymerase sigma-70 factor, ECF subfamily
LQHSSRRTIAAFIPVYLRMAGSREEAEDLTQEVFLKLFRKVSTLRGESRFSTWLHRLAVNEVLMYLRRNASTQCPLTESTLRRKTRRKRNIGGSMGTMTCG